MTVELRDLRPDVGAEFNFEAWEITLDRAAVESGDLTAEQFAALSDSVAHEARHALHHFRGIRAALVEGGSTTTRPSTQMPYARPRRPTRTERASGSVRGTRHSRKPWRSTGRPTGTSRARPSTAVG